MPSKRKYSSSSRTKKNKRVTVKKLAREVSALKRDTYSMRYPLYHFPIAPGSDMTTAPSYHVNLSTPGYVEWALQSPGSTSPNAIQGTKARLVAIRYNIQVHAGVRNVSHCKCRMIWYVQKNNTTLSGVANMADILTSGGSYIDALPAKHQSDNVQIIADKQFQITPYDAVFQSGGGLAPSKIMRFTIKIPKKYQLQEYDSNLQGTSKNQICFLMLSNQTVGAGQVPYVVQNGAQELVIVDQE